MGLLVHRVACNGFRWRCGLYRRLACNATVDDDTIGTTRGLCRHFWSENDCTVLFEESIPSGLLPKATFEGKYYECHARVLEPWLVQLFHADTYRQTLAHYSMLSWPD